MKTLLRIKTAIGVCLVMTGSIHGYAQDASTTNAIAKALHQFYAAMAARDVQVLQAVLDSTFLVVKSGAEGAETHLISTTDPRNLLPPEGNDDWQNLQLSDLDITVPSTHPSVATVTYSVFYPLTPEQLEMLKASMKAYGSQLDESTRRKFARLLRDKGRKETECAMLALRDGRWKIVTLSVPK